ncbi:hypothetical protein VTJ04DRAFT_2841 [Mycothermus thermophilus]|uniref:uncharacterized protein n=1 Tax=Humicola insolens TaxID=85995 RepID=UPI0037436D4D
MCGKDSSHSWIPKRPQAGSKRNDPEPGNASAMWFARGLSGAEHADAQVLPLVATCLPIACVPPCQPGQVQSLLLLLPSGSGSRAQAQAQQGIPSPPPALLPGPLCPALGAWPGKESPSPSASQLPFLEKTCSARSRDPLRRHHSHVSTFLATTHKSPPVPDIIPHPALPSPAPAHRHYPISICHHLIQHLLNLDDVQQLRNGLPYIITYTPSLGTCFLLIPRTTPKTVFPISVLQLSIALVCGDCERRLSGYPFEKSRSRHNLLEFDSRSIPVQWILFALPPAPSLVFSGYTRTLAGPGTPTTSTNLGPAPSHPSQLPVRGRPGPAEPVVTWSCTDVRTAW